MNWCFIYILPSVLSSLIFFPPSLSLSLSLSFSRFLFFYKKEGERY
ncbi:unnamed protein product [Brugia timori]|uniref:Uncharacterized protein n=1 Tax=Brugia timori TaxID=42155 RepID=A0A0R3RAY0_9BILA|nr:unnamed protein product [Brugia timori]